MKSKIRNRAIIILIVTIAGLAIVFKPHHKPGVKDFTSWSQIKQNLAENIHLGLDLRGGSHLVMQVQTNEVIQKVTQRNAEVARAKRCELRLASLRPSSPREPSSRDRSLLAAMITGRT